MSEFSTNDLCNDFNFVGGGGGGGTVMCNTRQPRQHNAVHSAWLGILTAIDW